MRDALRMMNNEKEEASKQYQNYVRQLDAQQTKLLSEVGGFVFGSLVLKITIIINYISID